MNNLRIEYDKSWKDVVTHLTEPFIDFFLHDLYLQIDWSFPPEFLEKELHNAKNIKKSNRIVDKLIKVQLLNGNEQWIFIHLEFQTDASKSIGNRMYEYYQLIRERYGKEIVALVIYTGNAVPKIYDTYFHEYFGTSITYKFNSYIVSQQSEEMLLSNDNPFSLVVLSNLYLLLSKNDNSKRYEFKKKLYELGRNKSYSVDNLAKLLIFVSELVKLPFELEKKFENEVIKSNYKNANDMYKNLSQGSKTMVNTIVENVFGESYENVKAKQVKVEAELKQVDAQLSKSIVLLFQRVGMSAEEIAEHLGTNVDLVKQVLKKNEINI